MFDIQCYNAISEKGLSLLSPEQYKLDTTNPDAILVRSHKLHDMTVSPKLKAIARAGAGTNNIPVERLQSLGIPVFNTPGANANAVKELVIAALLLASRNVCTAWQQTITLQGEDIDVQVEQLKKQFAGTELPGKKIGVIGLGAIGVLVANATLALGMEVIAYDPHITVKNAWQLSSQVQHAQSLDEMLEALDFVTVHVPFTPQTQHLLNRELLQKLPNHCTVLNFARGEIIDSQAIIELLQQKKLRYYVTDFPKNELLVCPNVIPLPHLGASTAEAEDSCAVMAVENLKAYLEFGNINYSVNFPSASLGKPKGSRLTITNKNIPNMVGQISSELAKHQLNIIDMLNKSKQDIAYNIIDVEGEIPSSLIEQLSNIEGVLKCRQVC